MKFSYNWLKELVNFKENPRELAEAINLHITEAESVTSTGSISGLIVAEVLEIEPHPNADKLRLATLDIGRGRRAKIICGAANLEVGQKVPLASVGTKLPGGEIKKATIRGVESNGMICSAEELGLEEKSQGIMVLPKRASVGRPAGEYIEGGGDSILDLKILSNRPDYLSYVGMAREIAAVLGKPWSMPLDLKFKEDKSISCSQKIKVSIKDSKLCPYYVGRWVGGIEVRESPDWIKEKLLSNGIRPINNLVDISNLVMLETGQPVHIFDADKVKGGKIIVRPAKANESIMTLDGETRKLNPEVLVIADQDEPIALAGIMGGELSAVSDLTQAVVVEVASFNPVAIRRGSKSLGLSTDASLRFERGPSPHIAEMAIKRTLALIQQECKGAVIAKGSVEAGSAKVSAKTISFSAEEMSNFAGSKITGAQIEKILSNLEFSIKKSGKTFKVVAPPSRRDVVEFADVAEEVIRMYGINKTDISFPIVKMDPPERNDDFESINQLKDLLVRHGFSETPTHAFIGPEWSEKLGIKLSPQLKLVNPLHSYWSHLTPALWPNLLSFVAKQPRTNLKVFEINNVFAPPAKGDVLPRESLALSVVVSGPDAYRLIRGIIERVLEPYADTKLVSVPGSSEGDKFINVSRVLLGKEVVGTIEEVGSQLGDSVGLPNDTVWVELNLSALFSEGKIVEKRFAPYSLYPDSQFDISVELPKSVSAGEVIGEIKSSSPVVVDVEVFDIYRPQKGTPSMGLRITLQAPDRTLTQSEINALQAKINNLVTSKFRGKIRGSSKG